MARSAIAANKSRSLLTMLGIIIGVGSVVLMTAVGQSMEGLILSQISSLGSRSMVVFPGQEGPQSFTQAGFDSITFDDVRALEKLTTIESLAPIIYVSGNVRYGREEAVPTVMGTVANFFNNQNIKAEQGRLLEPEDETKARDVAVLGADTAIDLFGNADPIGKRITVRDRGFTVVGVMERVGTQFFQNFDERVIIPLAVSRSMTGQRYINQMTMLATERFDLAFDDVKALLRQRHQIDNPDDDPEEDDFIVRSSEQANEILGTVSLGLTLFITTIAAISLIVGGIGIMNIMLVAVTERTREIGLRKAVGARRRDVLLQFVIEAILLTLFGGLIGAVGGILMAAIIAGIVHKFLDTYSFALNIPAIIVAFAMAGVTGLVFGLYPARKASQLRPIEALRYE